MLFKKNPASVNNLLFIISVCIFLCMLTSCPTLFEEKEPESEYEYLKLNFPGEFTNKRSIPNPDTQYSDRSSYTKFFSSELQKDVVVETDYYYSGTKKHPSYKSNYLFVKNEEKLNLIDEYVAKDFSQTRIISDFEFVTTWSTEKDNLSVKELIKGNDLQLWNTDKYILIHLTETEADELEERLHSLAWRLYDNCINNPCWWNTSKIYFFISTPQTKTDLSTLTKANLFQNADISTEKSKQLFSYQYKQQVGNCYLKQMYPEVTTQEAE